MLLIYLVLCFNCAFCYGTKLELLPNFIDVLNGSKNCYEESREFLNSLENMTLWAYESKSMVIFNVLRNSVI